MDANQRHAQAQHEVRQTSREDAPTGWRKKERGLKAKGNYCQLERRVCVRVSGTARPSGDNVRDHIDSRGNWKRKRLYRAQPTAMYAGRMRRVLIRRC